MVVGDIFDPILSPLLNMNSALAILIITITTSLIITILHKYVTNQALIKSSKERQKKIREEIKKHRDNPEKMMKLNKESMAASLPMLKETMKVTAITAIPFLLIFAWLYANFAFYPLEPNQEFTIEAQIRNQDVALLEILPSDRVQIISDANATVTQRIANWVVQGEAGEYTLRISAGDSMVERDLKIGDKYSAQRSTHGEDIRRIEIGNTPRRVNLLGFSVHWLLAYFIFSIITTIIARKLFRVH